MNIVNSSKERERERNKSVLKGELVSNTSPSWSGQKAFKAHLYQCLC